MRSFVAFFLMLLVALFLNLPFIYNAVCWGAEEQKELFIGTTASLDGILPVEEFPGEGHYVRNFVAPPLVYRDLQGKWDCFLCKIIPTSESGSLTIVEKGEMKTFWEIKPEFFWGDGTPVTGYDVERTVHYLANRSDDPRNRVYHVIKDILVDPGDPRKFQISFHRSDADFYQLLAISLIGSYVGKLNEDQGSLNIEKISLQPESYYGPYVIEQVEKNKTTLKRNTHYKGKNNHFPVISMVKMGTKKELLEKLFENKIDLIKENELAISDFMALKERQKDDSLFSKQIKPLYITTNTLEALTINLRNPTFVDFSMREALFLAIDRSKIVKEVYGGYAEVAHHFISTGNVNFKDAVRQYQYNPKQAAKILDGVGWMMQKTGIREKNGELLILEVITDQSDERKEIVKMIKEDWQKIGIGMVVKEFPEKIFEGKIIAESRFRDAALFSWQGPINALLWHGFHSSQIPSAKNSYTGQNIGGWFSKEVDQLLEELAKEHGGEQRKVLIASIMEYFVLELPILPLVFRPSFAVIPTYLDGFQILDGCNESSLPSQNWQLIRSHKF